MKNTINDIDIMVVGDGIAFAEKLASKLWNKKNSTTLKNLGLLSFQTKSFLLK